MIECKSEKANYCCKTEIGGFTIQSDVTEDKSGLGNGIRPHDILATAFASCLNMSVRMACDKKQIRIDSVTSKVNLIREESKTIFTYQIEFSNSLPEDTRQDILKIIENCPVRKTLSKPIEFQLIQGL
jgi:putative redox protein